MSAPPDRDTRDACHDLLARYGHALDWLDAAALANVFWPDAAIDYGFYKGDAAGFVPVVMAIEQGVTRRFHLTTGTVIRAVDDDRILADSVAITHGVRAGPDGDEASTVYFGRYVDTFSRRDGHWRLFARTYLLHGATSLETGTLPLSTLMLANGLSPDHQLSLQHRAD